MKATQQLFPYKLYRLLEALGTSSSTGDETAGACIAWLQHGKAFIIHDEDVFLSKYAATYFKQTKMRSFFRQVLLWGFKRITDGPDKGAWYHPHFLHGKPSSLRLITRTAIKKNTTDRKVAEPEARPNFYVMPPIEMDTPDAAKSASGMNYPPHPRDHGGWLLSIDASTPGGRNNFKIADEGRFDADGVLHQKLAYEREETFSMASFNNQDADLQLIPEPTMQRTSANVCPNLNFNSFGHTGQLNETYNACVLKSEEQVLKFDALAYGDQEQKQRTISSQGTGQLHQTHTCAPLKSEEQDLNFDELANGDKELKKPTISSRLQTTMPNSINWNNNKSNDKSNAAYIPPVDNGFSFHPVSSDRETSPFSDLSSWDGDYGLNESYDLVMKACQYAFRGLPPRQVTNMNMSEDNGSTRVLPFHPHAHPPMMQRINDNASYTPSSTYHQQSQGVPLPPVGNGFSFYPISIDRDTISISDLSNSATLFEEEVEFGSNKSDFTAYSSSPEPSSNREVKDDFAQFINDTLPPFDDEIWV